MWLSLIWFILVLFVCWNLFCTIANLRIKCVTETKNVSVLFYKNVKSSFSTWFTHLTLRFLYILSCSGPRCASASASAACLFCKENTRKKRKSTFPSKLLVNRNTDSIWKNFYCILVKHFRQMIHQNYLLTLSTLFFW